MPFVKTKKPESTFDEINNVRTMYEVFGVQYKHGYPFFTIYKDGAWITVSAKYYEPVR